MSRDKSTEDIPKVVASVMAIAPSLVLRTGWAYLMMRKSAHKASKKLEHELVSGGVPAEYAEKLAGQYACDLSLKKMIKTMDVPFSGSWKWE